MINDPYLENNASRDPAVELLMSMGYKYISPQDCVAERCGNYNVVLKDILRGQLRRLNRYCFAGAENEFSAANIERAIDELNEPLTDGLVRTSEKIYDMLMMGQSYPEIVGAGRLLSFNLKYIDWERPENNLFHVTKEFSVDSRDKLHNVRPDIVTFINGIPFAVVECKSPLIPVEEAIEQNIRNQQSDYIPNLYKFAQIILATNKNSVKYATVNTPRKFWAQWEEQEAEFQSGMLSRLISDRTVTPQDKALVSLLSPQRAMELIRYFILYDANIKKIARYQQYFAVRSAIKTVENIGENGARQGGVIWHTQGSGKSLTMVMLAKYLFTKMRQCNPRVVVVTDRKELDRQITDTFAHTRLQPARATSGRKLVNLIQSERANVITCLINKFETAEKLSVVCKSPNVFLLVDESHRTNYGLLATKMRTVFPNGAYLGFTGTPLMKNEKNTLTKFGGLIHKYTIQDAVADSAVIPLIYEGRFVEQNVDQTNIDLWFEQTVKRLTEKQKQDLKQKWSCIKRLNSTSERIKRIALDINEHFLNGYKNTGFKAMLATNFKRDAVRYLECFERFGDLTCGVVISPPELRESSDMDDESADKKVIAYWKKMMERFGDADRYESTMKSQFVNGEIDILIVCSKLLTGFDAPLCQVMYIDKDLRDHGLLQAIARTNRLYEGKDFGMIIDYRNLITKLDEAVGMYSGSGLENFESGDLKGVAVDVISVVGTIREASSQLENIFINVKKRRDTEEIETFLSDEEIRDNFYKRLCAFGKALNQVINSQRAYAALPKKEREGYQDAFVFYSKVRRSVKIRYCDAIDNAQYEPLMQNLLDRYLSVEGLKQITNPIDIFNKEAFEEELEELGSLRAKADAIVSRLSKNINDKFDENPAYYDSFSQRIKAVLDEYKKQVISDAQYLAKMQSILNDYRQGKSNISYPDTVQNNVHAQAFYGVINAIFSKATDVSVDVNFLANVSLRITEIIERHSQVDWTNNPSIHDRISQDIDDLFYEYEKNSGLKVSFDLVDKIIENVKTVALRRFHG